MTGSRLGTALLVALVAGSSACDEALGPAGEFDARGSAETVEAMVAVTDGLGPAFASLEAAGEILPGETMPGLVWDGSLPPTLAASLRDAASQRADGYIPAEVLGVTFVWSEQEGGYVAGELEGAPEDGIRVLYYAVDPITEEPASPLNALGHVDLRELSTEASNRLGVEVVNTAGQQPVTLADYHVDGSFTWTQSSFEVSSEAVGYLSDGTDRLDFDFSQSLDVTDQVPTLTQDFAMSLAGADQAVSWQSTLSGDAATESGTLSVLATIVNGAEEVVLDLTGESELVDGEIRYQGVAVAFIGGTFEEPEFTDVNGDPLSAGQWAALSDVWQAFDALFELADGLLTASE